MDNTTKKCPICAEEIKIEARVCRYCKARFDVTTKGYCAHDHQLVEADENGKCSMCGGDLMDTHVESRLTSPTVEQEKAVGGKQVSMDNLSADQKQRRFKKSNVGSILLAILITLLVFAGGIFAVFYFAGGAELMKPVETVTFDTIDQYQKERHVTIEGFLHLPSSIHCDDACGLQLVDYDNPDKVLTIFVGIGGQNGMPEPNHMLRLSNMYDMDSLKVGLNNGVVAGNGASVILTGRICETTTNEICLYVDQVAQGSIPPTLTPSPTQPPTATPRPTSTPLPVNADFGNVCTNNGANVIIQGRIGSLPMFMFCGRTCSLTLKDPGSSGKYLYFEIVRGSLPNQMENLPDKYRDSDLKIHTNDAQVVGIDDLVTLQGMVVVFESSSDTMLGCKIYMDWIKTAP